MRSSRYGIPIPEYAECVGLSSLGNHFDCQFFRAWGGHRSRLDFVSSSVLISRHTRYRFRNNSNACITWSFYCRGHDGRIELRNYGSPISLQRYDFDATSFIRLGYFHSNYTSSIGFSSSLGECNYDDSRSFNRNKFFYASYDFSWRAIKL